MVVCDDFFQVWFVDWYVVVVQDVDFCLVDVEIEYVVFDVGEIGVGDKFYVIVVDDSQIYDVLDFLINDLKFVKLECLCDVVCWCQYVLLLVNFFYSVSMMILMLSQNDQFCMQYRFSFMWFIIFLIWLVLL